MNTQTNSYDELKKYYDDTLNKDKRLLRRVTMNLRLLDV